MGRVRFCTRYNGPQSRTALGEKPCPQGVGYLCCVAGPLTEEINVAGKFALQECVEIARAFSPREVNESIIQNATHHFIDHG